MGYKTNKFSFVGMAKLVAIAIVFSWLFAPSASVSAATYTVTNTDDSGAGSFRQAVQDSNASTSEDDIIDFDIDGAGPHTITFGSNIYIYDKVTINGLSQDGSVCDGSDTDLKIHFDLNGVINPFYFSADAAGSELNGIAIANAHIDSYALFIEAPNTTVRCNFFGTFDGQTTVLTQEGSTGDFVLVGAPDVTIGGSSQTDMNLSLAPDRRFEFGFQVTAIDFRNNIAGVTLDGTTAVAGGRAIVLSGGEVIGGVIAHNFLYSSSGGAAIMLNRPLADMQITDNKIGVNKTGSAAFANAVNAITVSEGQRLTISNNHVAAADQATAIDLSNAYTLNDVVISNNKINVTADGLSSMGGSGSGAIRTITEQGVASYTNWEISDNQIYADSAMLDLGNMHNLTMTGNTVGMNATRTACFAAADPATWSGMQYSTDVVIGGTDPADANAFCGYHVGFEHMRSQDVSALGNTFMSDGGKAFGVISPSQQLINTPTIIGLDENGGSTDITFRMDVPAGQYRVEFFENDALLNPSNHPTAKTFAGYAEVTSSGTGEQEFTETIAGADLNYLSLMATLKDESADGFGPTSEIGSVELEANVAVETTDNASEILEGTEDHEFTQTFTNLGPTLLTQIDMSSAATECFTISSVATSGTATNTGTYDDENQTWSGLLEPNQTLVLTFTGDVDCATPNVLAFVNIINAMAAGDYPITNTSDSVVTFDLTDIVGLAAELEAETTDGVDEVFSNTTDHEFTQTITNNGPATITDIDFDNRDNSCHEISSVSVSGTATNTGTYDDENQTWSGLLEPDQTLILTFAVNVSCGGDQTLVFSHKINSMQNDGTTVEDTGSTEGYQDSTEIIKYVADTSVTNVFDGVASDVAIGSTLNYTLTFTNHGPQPMDVGLYDASMPGQNQLFFYMIPPELSYVGYSSNDNIACASLGGPGSAAGFGPSLANHADYDVIMCYVTTGTGNLLQANGSISANIQLEVGETSDLNFTNYALAGLGFGDPDSETMGGVGYGGEVIDYLIANPINNFAATWPVVDIAIEKEVAAGSTGIPGSSLSYDITLHNKGPMSFDLKLLANLDNGIVLFNDLYPGGSLSYVSADGEFDCLDSGVSSNVMGPAVIDHPSHQLLLCYYSGEDPYILNANDEVTVRLNFTIKEAAESSFTNYAGSTLYPNDPDAIDMFAAFTTAEGDIIDTLSNENFSKANFTLSENSGADTDGDGITDSVEDTGPNGGDANNDGMPDSEQTNVASFISSVTGKPVVLEVSDDCSVTEAAIAPESANTLADSGYSYPLGLLGFELECAEPGFVADVMQYYYDSSTDGFVLRKWHPVNETYFDMSDATLQDQTIDARSVAVAHYSVQDGGDLDIDGVTDSHISDPAGLGTQDDSGAGPLSETGLNIWLVALVAVPLIVAPGLGLFFYIRRQIRDY